MPRSARATVSRPGPEPMSRVGPSQRSRSDLSPGLSLQPAVHRQRPAAAVGVLDLRPHPAGQRVLVKLPDHADSFVVSIPIVGRLGANIHQCQPAGWPARS